MSEVELRALAAEYGQEQVFAFWDELNGDEREALCADLEQVDFALMARLTEKWIKNPPAAESFTDIEPVPCLPRLGTGGAQEAEAWAAGEDALRAGKVGLFLVAGGQGTRLGFDGPKGAYGVGPITRKTLFEYHAEKIHSLQDQYGCVLPWYIMVSAANGAATKAFFEEHDYFGLKAEDVYFITQRMVPCVDGDGKFMLAEKHQLAMNPNGHGGAIPAMVERGVLEDCRKRGVEYLSYFQVDSWAVKVADPLFVGYHVLQGAAMSSKNHRKREPREAVGVHCICDGVYHVIEYSELDMYPQLFEVDEAGDVVYYAGNPAIHMFSVDFVQGTYDDFEQFPWHLAHKKVPYVGADGAQVAPEEPNAYKFETFVFDALQLTTHPPCALEIIPEGEYTPIKSYEGDNSVVAARVSMNSLWSKWLEAAGYAVPSDGNGICSVDLEISPRFAWSKDSFVERCAVMELDVSRGLAILADGSVVYPE